MDKFLDLTGLTEYDQLIKNYVDSKSSGNSFGNIAVDSTTISADSATDTLTIEAGDNITITPDETNNKITISSSGGSSYTLPVATSSALGGVKSGTDITVDSSGNVSVNDDSHNHVISNVDGLLDILNENFAMYIIDLSSLSKNNFYPITFPMQEKIIDCEIHSIGGSSSLEYNQNVIHFQIIWQGWNDTPKSFNILQYGCYTNSEITIGCIGVGNKNGMNCVWLRGGLKYKIRSNSKPTHHDTDYANGDEIYTVGTNYYGGTNSNISIIFTPQSTISSGLYFDQTVKASKFYDGQGRFVSPTIYNASEPSAGLVNGLIWIG